MKTDIGSALKLCSPPTTETFTENAKRAAHWKASIEGTVSPIDALTHGWEHDGSYLKPMTVPEGTLSAPCSCCVRDDAMWVRIWL